MGNHEGTREHTEIWGYPDHWKSYKLGLLAGSITGGFATLEEVLIRMISTSRALSDVGSHVADMLSRLA